MIGSTRCSLQCLSPRFLPLQLSTDDFDGVLYNASNLAVKGIAAMAAYGYLLEQYTGNATAAEQVYATAARYAQVFVNYRCVG